MPITALGVLSHLPFLQYFTIDFVKHHTTNSVIRWIVWLNTIAVKSQILFKTIYEDSVYVKKIVNNIDDISKKMKEFTTETPLKESENVWINIVAYGTQNNTIIYDENYKYDILLRNKAERSVYGNVIEGANVKEELTDTILHELVNVYNAYKTDVMEIYSAPIIEDTEEEVKEEDREDREDREDMEDMEDMEDKLSDISSLEDTDIETENDTPELNEFMFIMKYHDRKTVRRYHKKEKEDTPITFNKSSVKFITVEYYHEEMIEPIELHLPKEYYIEGNHLFTPIFILMLLKNQSSPYHFDLNYKLYIIDKSAFMFQINANKYVLLGAEDYQVCDL